MISVSWYGKFKDKDEGVPALLGMLMQLAQSGVRDVLGSNLGLYPQG